MSGLQPLPAAIHVAPDIWSRSRHPTVCLNLVPTAIQYAAHSLAESAGEKAQLCITVVSVSSQTCAETRMPTSGLAQGVHALVRRAVPQTLEMYQS